MCGIAGVFSYRNGGVVSRSELLRMRDRMASRGPDGAEIWLAVDGQVGLAHRRLAIIDLSNAGLQPMVSADGRYVISFNGEIYNYRELRRGLVARGYKFNSHSDTEVILNLYSELGPNVVDSLQGMFAFAIWDTKNRTLFFARDSLGIKPLYYSDNGRTIRFASQVKALLASGTVGSTPHPAGHAGFFLFGSVPEPHTLYKEIRSLPAGHTMTVRPAGAETPKQYFNLASEYLDARERQITRDNALEGLCDSISASIRKHLVADVEVGVFLSAGVDSTVIAQLSAAETGNNIRALTLGFGEYLDHSSNEVPLASETAKALGSISEIDWIDRRDFEENLGGILTSMDQPSIDGVNTFFVSKLAARVGLKVALSGLGGDELFAGYSTFQRVPALVRGMARIPGRARAGRIVRRMMYPTFEMLTWPKIAGIFEYGGSIPEAYLLSRALYMPWELEDMLGAEFARQGLEDLDLPGMLSAFAPVHLSDEEKVACLEMAFYMRNQLLRDADWASMAHSLEIRVPFVDVQLLRAVAQCRAAGIAINKSLLVNSLPKGPAAAALLRSKTGFSIPVARWLKDSGRGTSSEKGYRPWARRVYESTVGQLMPAQLGAHQKSATRSVR